MPKKTIIIISLSVCFLFGGLPTLHPMVKSAILPGWGEKSMHNTHRARNFRLIEISLITGSVSAYTFSNHFVNRYESFAVEHANVDSRGKEHRYWVDIGNYSDMDSHNDEHLRFRDLDNLYDEKNGWGWIWDSKENRTTFENMRIRSDVLAMTGKFLVGSIVLNHIVSAIDALYLTRLQKIESIVFLPKISKDGTKSLSLTIAFN